MFAGHVISTASGFKLLHMGTASSSSFDNILSACKDQQVTGVLRVRDSLAEAEAEIHFLSGVRDSVRLGPVEGEEAMARISQMTNPEFSAMATLPPMSESSQQAFPQSGKLGDFRPVDLMRYCEVRCLTCSLYLNCADRQVKVNYELGDLQSVEPEPDLTISVLEAVEGTYRFELPAFDLPDMTAPRTFDAQGFLPESSEHGAANDLEEAHCETEEDASSEPELKFTSIAAPPPDSSIALDETLLDATASRQAANDAFDEEAAPTYQTLQAPPPRPEEDHDIFASLSPELLQQVLGEPQAPRRSGIFSEGYLYPAAAFIACVGMAVLAYVIFSPANSSMVDSADTTIINR